MIGSVAKMKTPLDLMNAEEAGERLRIAREAAGFTQAGASAAVNLARTTLVAIEQGLRKIRLDELQRLAQLYGTSVNSLMRSEAVHVDLVPRFRKLIGTNDMALRAAAQLLSDLARAEVELEGLLGIQHDHNLPPERPLLAGDVQVQAEQDAMELRQWLGLGNRPVPDIISLLEMELGVRVYMRPLDSRISGLFAFDSRLGACILLNSNHPQVRKNQSAVHELAHLVSTRQAPEVLADDATEKSPQERYAKTFGRAFLTPPRSVMQKFKEITAGSPLFTRRHVIILSHSFGVSHEAMVRRLEELKLIKTGTWDWFEANGGITKSDVRQVLGDVLPIEQKVVDAATSTTLRLATLANHAWRQGLLSEGQLAALLKLGRIELRSILDVDEGEGGVADDAPVWLK